VIIVGSVLLDDALARLAVRRPVFHSEADFQFALAWQVRELDPEIEVRLETPFAEGAHLDIEFRKHGRLTALELKYLTRPAVVEVAGETYRLRSRALDKRRYDVVKDVTRIEQYVAARPDANGAVVVLASDDALWRAPLETRRASSDAAYRIHEGAILSGELAWGPTAGPGSIRGREAVLRVLGEHTLGWRPYSTAAVDLRALVVEIESR
jgi:hypothetical protein